MPEAVCFTHARAFQQESKGGKGVPVILSSHLCLRHPVGIAEMPRVDLLANFYVFRYSNSDDEDSLRLSFVVGLQPSLVEERVYL